MSTRRVALITGGRRVGLAVSEALAVRGFDIALSFARSEAQLGRQPTRQRAMALGRRSFRRTLRSRLNAARSSTRRLTRSAASTRSSIWRPRNVQRSLADLTVDDWNAALDVDNLRAAFLGRAERAPHMRRLGGGHVVLVSDWVAASGRPRYPGYVPYYVAKAGVIALTEALALELAADHILVNCIAPGLVLPLPGASAESQAAVERCGPARSLGRGRCCGEGGRQFARERLHHRRTIRVDGGRHLR